MKGLVRLSRLAGMLLLALGLGVGDAAADEYYFVDDLRLAVEPEAAPLHAHLGHARAGRRRGPDLNTYNLELSTISWLPPTLDVKVLRPWPEPGVNLDLYQTLQAVTANNESITMWGPFVVHPHSGSGRWIRQILESGQAEYRAISTAAEHPDQRLHPRGGRGGSRCSAVTTIRSSASASPPRATSPTSSCSGALFDQYQYNNAWLIPRLGLDRYPIEVVPPQAIAKVPCGLCKRPD